VINDRGEQERVVSLRAVSKSFVEGEARHVVLDGVDLDIHRGEFVALLGRSGSGKSTLLNLISGIDVPDAGTITVAGTRLHLVGEQERSLFRRRHVGFVFQFFNLLPTLTVAENVILPMQLNDLADAGADAALRLLGRVGLEARGDSFPDRLSGGEQQRVAIARALAHDPEILLADEPTGNLDVAIGRDILALLLEVAGDRGKTLLVATHSHEVAASADRVLRVIDHALVEISKDEL
jgi:putative ABC transport system ATP-binding protein